MHIAQHPPPRTWPSPDPKRTGCRSCGHLPANRPRGLCTRCYSDTATRVKFTSGSKYAARGVGNGCRNALPPDEPTAATPGTPDKLEVLAARAALGQSLWHPLDSAIPAPAAEVTTSCS